jgi:hypothetical protein
MFSDHDLALARQPSVRTRGTSTLDDTHPACDAVDRNSEVLVDYFFARRAVRAAQFGRAPRTGPAAVRDSP